MDKKERFSEAYNYLRQIGLAHTQKDVAEKMQSTPPNVSSAMKGVEAVLTDSFLRRFNAAYGNIFSVDWLINGNGEMLDSKNLATDLVTIQNDDVIMIPVINLDARGGFDANYYVDTPESVVERMPFSRSIAMDGDCVIPVYGDSMSPKYPSGSFILIRCVELWREYIEYGAAYVLELVDERRLIKNIRKSTIPDYFLLESVNPAYEPSDIAMDMIKKVFRVLMCVRRESI